MLIPNNAATAAPTRDPSFARPAADLARRGVSVQPAPGQGIALDSNGKLPSSLHVPRVFTSAWSGGPPTAASSGDFWAATNVDSAFNSHWLFQAESDGSYNWKFISGTRKQIAQGNLNTVINTASSPSVGTGQGPSVHFNLDISGVSSGTAFGIAGTSPDNTLYKFGATALFVTPIRIA
jgi:hypothetical protein